MAKKLSAGILLYRRRIGKVEVFLVHPGGPFWARKDDGAWSISKGEYTVVKATILMTTAKGEFFDETSCKWTYPIPQSPHLSINRIYISGLRS